MTMQLRHALAALLLLACTLAQAAPARLLWFTAEVTPVPRTALLERLAAEAGFELQHLEVPLRGPDTLPPAQLAAVQSALDGAALAWIDAPHPSVTLRLQRLLGSALQDFAARHGAQRVAWVTPGATSADTSTLQARIAAYLDAGGEANLRHAVALARALVDGRPAPELPPPAPLPARGLYHPDAPALFADAAAFGRWQATQSALQGKPAVALLVHRQAFVNGATQALDAWLRAFAREGLAAYAVFGTQIDAPTLAALLEVPAAVGGPSLHPRLLVTHLLLPQAAALQPLFQRWGVPVLATQPYRSGSQADWERDAAGLASADVPIYLAQPEAAGAIDPLPVIAHADQGRQPQLIERQALAVIAKARRLIALRDKPNAEKRLVAFVYNYPPGGTNFGASFLNVPRSLEQVSSGLAQAGYPVQPLAEQAWIDGLKPLLGAYYRGADLVALLDSGQADALPLAEYEAWWRSLPAPQRERIEAQWGAPASSRYVVAWRGQRVFVIPRLQAGALAVLPQPPREETLRQGQDPFMHRNSRPLAHHYLAVYLWARQHADALIHFGTHGTQEWAPGKARALDVLDDALLPLGDVPVVYPYIVDNLGEALTAKRRGRALMVSHRTPVLAPAGFESRMAHMHELMHEWETVDAGPTRQALERELIAQFVEHQLHRDLGWTAERIAADFAGFLEQLHPWLDRLAQSAQPRGLAVFGRVPDEASRRQQLLQMLRQPLIEALGEDIDEVFLIDHAAVATSRPGRWLDVALRDAEAASRLDLRPPEPVGPVPNRAARKPIDTPALRALAERAQALERLLSTEGELPGLLAALEGRFVPAAYGGDPIRNPESLPTGRNLTGLDPSRLPTRQAYEVAKRLFNDWLTQWRAEHGERVPARLALSLWAGETLRHQGVMEAQALVALGVQPVWDDSGRPLQLRVIPRSELGRERVDVLLSVTGSYRDQFPALMGLVDRAVAAAGSAETGNAIARHDARLRAELERAGVPAEQAALLARARVFGNRQGDYGTGLSDAVQADGLKREDERLGAMFLQRMSQPFVDGQALDGVPEAAAAQALGAHLRVADAALMSRSSHLFAMATSDDPFQYLGGLAAAARAAGKSEALGLYVSQLQDSGESHTETAGRALSMEMQSRYLHPGWLKAQREEGYAGTLQVLKAVQFVWGWQATAPDTVRSDHWQSLHEVLVRDRHGLGLPQWLRGHPQAYAQVVERLIQAQRLGHWQPDAATRQEVARLYAELTRAAPLAQELKGVRQWVQSQVEPEPVPVAPAVPRAPTPAVQPRAEVRKEPEPEPKAVPKPRVGVLLKRQPELKATVAPLLSQALALVAMALVMVGGAAWQGRQVGRKA
ncbi:cobaltochelatase subunit CobN [Azohydromonas australica]|uniref:cobaltochelatase subunit CobN n=1 Tax=Azohydromonas australica TaxID=364039 RepID=UPI000406A538|nr:cobaltochelatase subunit CobN [Azohydromonas australica]